MDSEKWKLTEITDSNREQFIKFVFKILSKVKPDKVFIDDLDILCKRVKFVFSDNISIPKSLIDNLNKVFEIIFYGLTITDYSIKFIDGKINLLLYLHIKYSGDGRNDCD